MPKANREHKSDVFALLLSERERFLDVYSALADKSINSDIAARDVSLQDALFMNFINDIAYLVGDTLVILIEHQSTVNENLPLRLLMYVARVYEKLVDDESIYRKQRIALPTPYLIVLYNGEEKYPAHVTLKLSDAFKTVSDELKISVDGGMLELAVDVYNINDGMNSELVSRSRNLQGYVTFEAKVREYFSTEPSLSDAIDKALDYCRDNDILQDFLPQHASEVKNMLTATYSLERGRHIIREEALQEGEQRGEQRGRQLERNTLVFNLRKRGTPDSDIADIIGQPLEYVQQIQEEAHAN